MPRGRGGYGRGYGYFTRGYGRGLRFLGWGAGMGNTFPFCRWFPWLPRRWWTYSSYGLPYYTGYYPRYYGYTFPSTLYP